MSTPVCVDQGPAIDTPAALVSTENITPVSMHERHSSCTSTSPTLVDSSVTGALEAPTDEEAPPSIPYRASAPSPSPSISSSVNQCNPSELRPRRNPRRLARGKPGIPSLPGNLPTVRGQETRRSEQPPEVKEEEQDSQPENGTRPNFWGNAGGIDLKALEKFADGRPTIILNPVLESESEEEIDVASKKTRKRGRKATSMKKENGMGRKRARVDDDEEGGGDNKPDDEGTRSNLKSKSKRAKATHPEHGLAKAEKSKAKAPTRSKTAKATRNGHNTAAKRKRD